jgi:hypothetical protein
VHNAIVVEWSVKQHIGIGIPATTQKHSVGNFNTAAVDSDPVGDTRTRGDGAESSVPANTVGRLAGGVESVEMSFVPMHQDPAGKRPCFVASVKKF